MNTKVVNKTLDIFKLNMRTLVKRKTLWLYLALFYILSILLSVIFLPFRYAGGPVLMTYLVTPIFIIMGWTGYNVRKSSLYSNIKTSGQKNTNFYSAQILTILVVGNVLSLLFFLLMVALSPFNIFAYDWGLLNKDPINVYFWKNGAWINFIYVTEITIILTFSIYFLLHSFMKSERTYYIVVVSLYLLGVIFAGSLNNYYGVPWWQVVILGDDSIPHSSDFNLILTNEEFEFFKQNITIAFEPRTMEISHNLFPEYLFIPTLLFPYFGVGQFMTTTVFAQAVSDNYYSTSTLITNSDTGEIFKLSEILGYGNSWNYFSLSFTKDTWEWTVLLIQPYAWVLTSLVTGTAISKINIK